MTSQALGGASGIDRELEALAADFSGVLSVSARHLETGELLEFAPDVVLPTASVIKVPILVALFDRVRAGAVSLKRRVNVQPSAHVPGSGVLKVFASDVTPTLEDLATLMIVASDNTATNIVLSAVGGPATVNALMGDLGLGTIRLHNEVDFVAIGDDVRRFAEAAASDLRALNELIAQRKILSADACDAIEGILEKQQHLDQAGRYLTLSPDWRALGRPAPQLRLGSKTGFFPGTCCDAGVVRFPSGGFAYATFAHQSADLSNASESEGRVLNGLVVRALVEHWWPASDGPAPVRPARR